MVIDVKRSVTRESLSEAGSDPRCLALLETGSRAEWQPVTVAQDSLLPSSMSTDDEEPIDESLFKEPEGYYAPEKPATYAEHTLLLSGETLKLRLVGHNPLWVRGRLDWPASAG